MGAARGNNGTFMLYNLNLTNPGRASEGKSGRIFPEKGGKTNRHPLAKNINLPVE
jgi:hypothetical protein